MCTVIAILYGVRKLSTSGIGAELVKDYEQCFREK